MAEIFNGQFIVAPSTNVYVDTSNLANLNTGGSNTLAIVACGTAGIPQVPFPITDPGTAKRILRSGPLLEAALIAFDPSNATGGATTIYGVRVNSAVQARNKVYDSLTPATASGTVTVGTTVGSGDVYTVTIGGVAVTYTASGTDTASSVASALVTAINTSTNNTINDAVNGVTASSNADVVTITANSAGIDGNSITLTASATGTGDSLTASSGTLTGGSGNTVFTLTSDDYGLYTNQVYFNFATASVNGVKATVGLTTVGNLTGGVFSQDNIYRPLFSIQYTGSGSACTLTVNDSTLTTAVTGAGDNLNVSFSTYATVQQVVDYINATGKYTATISLPASGAYASAAQFDPNSAVDVKSSAVTLTANLQAIIDWFNQTAPYVTAVRNTNPASGAPALGGNNRYLKGGSDGTTLIGDWTNAINSLQAQNCQIVVPISTDSAVHSAVAAHVQYMSQTAQNRRIAVVGGALNEYSTTAAVPTQTISNRAIALNSSRVVLASPGVKYYNSSNILTLSDSSYTAAFVGGMLAAVPPGTPLTHKLLSNVYGLETNYTPADINALLQTGVLPIQYVQNKGYWVVQSITTWNGAPNYANNEISVVLEIDAVVMSIQSALDSQLIGRTVSPTTLAQACSITQTQLLQATNAGYIVGDSDNPSFQNISASANGDAINVQFEMSPAIPANYVNISISTSLYSGTVTTASTN